MTENGCYHVAGKYKIRSSPSVGAKPSIYSVRWSTDGKLLASAIDDGRIRVYDGSSGRTKFSLVDESPQSTTDSSHAPAFSSSHLSSKSHLVSEVDAEREAKVALSNKGINAATIALRFNPALHANQAGGVSEYTLLSASSSGTVRHWKIFTADGGGGGQGDVPAPPECTNETHLGPDSVAFCLDYNARGNMYAAGCKDAVVRIFDEETRALKQTLDGGGGSEYSGGAKVARELPSADYALKLINKSNAEQSVAALNKEVRQVTRHSNRIYSVKFATGFSSHVDNLVISAGWDRTMQVWDLRVPGPPVKSFFGVYLAGDALDAKDSEILTASHRPVGQLQLWDMRFGGEPREVQAANDGKLHEYYTAQFSSNRDVGSHFHVHASEGDNPCFIAAGGLGESCLSILDHSRDDAVACVVSDLPGGVVSLDFCPRIFNPPDDAAAASTAATPTKATLDTQPKASKYAYLKEQQSPGVRYKQSSHSEGTRIAIACRDASIRVVDICRTRGGGFACLDEEEEVEDGDDGADDAEGLPIHAASPSSASKVATAASPTAKKTGLAIGDPAASSGVKSIPGLGLSPSWSDPGSAFASPVTAQSGRGNDTGTGAFPFPQPSLPSPSVPPPSVALAHSQSNFLPTVPTGSGEAPALAHSESAPTITLPKEA